MRVTDLYSDALGPTPLLYFTPTLLDLPSKFPEPCCGTTRKLTVFFIAVAEHAFDRQARYDRILKKVERYSRYGVGVSGLRRLLVTSFHYTHPIFNRHLLHYYLPSSMTLYICHRRLATDAEKTLRRYIMPRHFIIIVCRP